MALMLEIFLVQTCICQIASKLSLVNKSLYLFVWAFLCCLSMMQKEGKNEKDRSKFAGIRIFS